MSGKSSASMDHAKVLLRRAIEEEQNEEYEVSLTLYEEGIKHLMTSLKDIPSSTEEHKILRSKITDYLTRAEHVKQLVVEKKQKAKLHHHIIIKDNEIGFSYKVIFSKYLDEKVKDIVVRDPYIRFHHQVQNFVRFVELAITSCINLKTIKLVTSKDPERFSQQEESFKEINNYLVEKKKLLTYEYSATLHDRSVTLSNGYVIKLGRGLDYFKSPAGKYTPGFFELDLRPCQETTIDVFWQPPNTK